METNHRSWTLREKLQSSACGLLHSSKLPLPHPGLGCLHNCVIDSRQHSDINYQSWTLREKPKSSACGLLHSSKLPLAHPGLGCLHNCVIDSGPHYHLANSSASLVAFSNLPPAMEGNERPPWCTTSVTHERPGGDIAASDCETREDTTQPPGTMAMEPRSVFSTSATKTKATEHTEKAILFSAISSHLNHHHMPMSPNLNFTLANHAPQSVTIVNSNWPDWDNGTTLYTDTETITIQHDNMETQTIIIDLATTMEQRWNSATWKLRTIKTNQLARAEALSLRTKDWMSNQNTIATEYPQEVATVKQH